MSRRLPVLAAALAFLSLSCERSTSPEQPFVPDPASLARAAVLHVDLATASVAATPASHAGKASFSIIGRDGIQATATGLTRTTFNSSRDLVRFDLTIVNEIDGHELRPPKALPAPDASTSVFAFPYAVTVTQGSGSVEPSNDWNGAPFDFVTGAKCGGKSGECFPYKSYASPLRPGQASPAATVGFLVDKKVTSFDVYVLVAADIVAIPTGVVEVTLNSAVRGPMAGVSVFIDGSIEAVTNAAGLARFPSAVVGTRTISVPTVPDGCTAPASQTATVVVSQTTSLAFDVSCQPAVLALSDNAHDFGTVTLGSTGAAQTFTLTNSGGSMSSAISAALTGDQASDFVLGNDQCSNASLAAGANCTFSISLRPSASGPRAATLTLSATQGGSVALQLTGTGIAPAALNADVASYNFGAEGVGGTAAARTFTISNAGGIASGVLSVTLTGANAADFSITDNSCTASLASGAHCTVSVAVSPSSTDARNATLTVSGSPGGAATVLLSASGVRSAAVELSPSTLDVGSVIVGQSKLFTITTRNTGGGATGLLTAALGGANAAEFSIDPSGTTCGPRLAGGDNCVVSLAFQPTSNGPKTASVSVTGTPGGTGSATLTARGLSVAALSIDRASTDFGGVIIGATAQATFTITNTGESDASGLSVAFSGDNAAEFTQNGGSCGTTLGAGQSCTVVLQFFPTARGARSGTITVAGTVGGSARATLAGNGLNPANLVSSVPRIDFGNVVTHTVVSAIVTMTNTGDVASGQITPLNRSSTQTVNFIDNCAFRSLSAGASCTVSVTWGPVSPGTLPQFMSASISAFASPGGVLDVPITGLEVIGAILGSAPASFNFGNVVIGTASTQTFTITNSGGVASSSTAVALSATSADFTIVSTDCAALAIAQSCSVVVRFTPLTPGSKSLSLVASPSPGKVLNVSLSGFGATPAAIQLSTSSVDFGHQRVNDGAVNASLTISNAGSDPTGTLSISISGGSNQFSVQSSSCGSTLPGLGSCQLVLRYEPAIEGQQAASITVSGTPGGSQTTNITGFGDRAFVLNMDASPNTIDFGSVPFGTSVDRTLTLTNRDIVATEGLFSFAAGPQGGFSLVSGSDGCTGKFVAPNASCSFVIRFSPAFKFANTLTWGGSAGVSAAGLQIRIPLTATSPPSPPEP